MANDGSSGLDAGGGSHSPRASIDRVSIDQKKVWVCDEEAQRKLASEISRSVGWLGFDMDHTLIEYNVQNLYPLIHDFLVQNIVQQGFPRSHFEVKFDPSCVGKGLILDFGTGDLLQVSEGGEVVAARHGRRTLSRDEIKAKYGNRWKHFDDLKEFRWGGNFNVFLTYFDIPSQYVCQLLTEYYDQKKWFRYDYWPKVLKGFIDNFTPMNFRDKTGMFFPALIKNPQKYIVPRPNVTQWIKNMSRHGSSPRLFLVTNSHVDFADFLMNFSFGKEWKSMFEAVIYFSAKGRGFFSEDPDFIHVDPKDCHCSTQIADPSLGPGNEYIGGSAKVLNDLFVKESSTSSNQPKVCYVGDHLKGDVLLCAVHTEWKTVYIAEELKKEPAEEFRSPEAFLPFFPAESKESEEKQQPSPRSSSRPSPPSQQEQQQTRRTNVCNNGNKSAGRTYFSAVALEYSSAILSSVADMVS